MPTSEIVDAWFEEYDNPHKTLVDAVRRVVLDTDDRVTETIKWRAPTFVYRETSRPSSRSLGRT